METPLEDTLSPYFYQDYAYYLDLIYLSSNSTPFHLGPDIDGLHEFPKIEGSHTYPISVVFGDHLYQDSTLLDILSNHTF